MKPGNALPSLSIVNRQRRIALAIDRILKIVTNALPDCLECPGPGEAPLFQLDHIDISIVSERTMARVHVDFLGIPGPTDVITFPYGEIVVCAQVAADNAQSYGTSPTSEVALYIIHGLLHLAGYDDVTPDLADQMHQRQANILKAAENRL